MALQQIDILLAGVRDTSGNVLSGGKVYTYNAGTLTPKATYVDSAGATPATNPIILDSAGRAQVYADGAFKLVVDDSSNANIYAWDNLYFARVTSAVSQWPDIYGGTSTGSASVYAVTVPLTISGYTAGQEFKFIANHDTTGAAATLNVNSQGAVSLVKGPANTALAAGDIKSGDIVCVVYDSSGGGRFKITTIAGSVSPTPLFIDRGNGRVGIGTTSPAQILDVQGGNIAEGSASTLDHTITQYTASTAGPTLALQKSRNATLGANTIVTNGDTLGSIVFRGANGTSYSDAVAISAVSNGAPGASADMPGALIFSTSADASATPTERMRIDSTGKVGIGLSSPQHTLHVHGSSGNTTFQITNSTTGTIATDGFCLLTEVTSNAAYIDQREDSPIVFRTNSIERARLTGTAGNGSLFVGTTTGAPIATNTTGIILSQTGTQELSASVPPLYINRTNAGSGNLIEFFQGGSASLIGAISTNGSGTVTYGAFCGNHWAQLANGVFANILAGTVLETIDELCEWPGETEDRLARVQVSTTVASKAVYGVFMNWDAEWTATHDMRVASLGAYFVRVHSSQTVQKGDLLESNGDGTARVQASDTIKSSTIGKVTCSIPSETYPDGSYLIPAVLYCG